MTYPATKLTIVVEKFLQPEIERMLTAAGVKGWSVFMGGGNGQTGLHRVGGVMGEFAIVKFEVVMRERALAEQLANELVQNQLEEQAGIVWLDSVDLIRRTRV